MDNNAFINDLAKENGFDEVGIINTDEFSQYKNIIEQYNIDYGMESNPKDLMEDATSIIVLLSKYNPYDKSYFKEDYLFVDSYYVESNKSYQNSQKISDEIVKIGYKAIGNPRIPFRHCAFRAGMGNRGVNGLLRHDLYGNYVLIQCILTNMPLNITNDSDEVAFCSECNLCMNACKYDALTKSGVVTRSKCKRNYMPAKKYIPEFIREHIGMDLIGCTDCRDACPANKNIKKTAPPKDLLNACYMPNLMDFDNNKDSFETLVKYIGKNEIRKLRLAKSLVLIAGNTNDKKYIPLIKKLADRYNDDEINEYSKWSVDRLSKEK